MRTFRTLLIGIARSGAWPGFIALMAYAARQAPWPRGLAISVSAAVAALALAAFASNLARWLFAPGGWAETALGVPPAVASQARRTALTLCLSGTLCLIPVSLCQRGLIAPGGRPLYAPAAMRLLTLLFECTVLGLAVWLLRRRSPLVTWVAEFPERLGWLARRGRLVPVLIICSIGAVILLDVRGYSYSARRLASGGLQSLLVAAACLALYRLTLRAIDRHAWRWFKVGQTLAGHGGHGETARSPDDLANRLRRLAAYLVPVVGLLLGAWVWGVDLALFTFLAEQPLWTVDAKEELRVTIGDLTRALAILTACGVAWRHMSTLFAVAVFPRMPDDPGIRFAVVTLCRYLVLGVGLLCGLSSVHLGMEKIGVVLAALGVGLGFGLQEIVSNFVCGIILLLERPIRVGDIVTVTSMTGKVDRINIRATTITNFDNQSMIVPNRAFITSDLVNWTLKDKVVRVTVRVKVAHRTDPDKVSEILLAIARDDADVLRNPVPSALMEDFSDSALVFVLHTHVPDPSLAGRVKHRIFGQIQNRFAAAGIAIPLPTQELLFKPAGEGPRGSVLPGEFLRADAPSRPQPPHVAPVVAPSHIPAPLAECHRGVDE